MKIYMLIVNQVAKDPPMISSNYSAPRTAMKTEYYASRENAESRRNTIYAGVKALTGFIDGVEVTVTPIEVIE